MMLVVYPHYGDWRMALEKYQRPVFRAGAFILHVGDYVSTGGSKKHIAHG